MVVVSECGRILRIGSRIYIRNGAEYEVLESFGEKITHSEELNAADESFAIVWRRRSADRDMKCEQRSPLRTGTSEQGHGAVKVDSEPSSSSDSDIPAPESCSEDLYSEEETRPEASAAQQEFPESIMSDSGSFRTKSSQSSLSARSSTSGGSTDFKSDEIKDEALMNDFESDSDPQNSTTGDDAGSFEGSSSIMDPAADLDDSSLSASSSRSARSGSPRSKIAASIRAGFESKNVEWEHITDAESDQSDVEPSSGSESSADSNDEDDSEGDDAGLRLGELLEPRRKQVEMQLDGRCKSFESSMRINRRSGFFVSGTRHLRRFFTRLQDSTLRRPC